MKLISSPFSYGPTKPVERPPSEAFNVVSEDIVAVDIMAGITAAIWAALVKFEIYSSMFLIYALLHGFM